MRRQHAVALHSFAGGEGQLSLRIGDRLSVEIVTPDGWVLGRRIPEGGSAASEGKDDHDAEEGYFPLSYVEIRDEEQHAAHRDDADLEESPRPAARSSSMIVLADFEGDEDLHGLSVRKDEIVHVIDIGASSGGWTFCENDAGEKGYVPVSYLRPALETLGAGRQMRLQNSQYAASCCVTACAGRVKNEGEACKGCQNVNTFNERVLGRPLSATATDSNSGSSESAGTATQQTMLQLLINKLVIG